MTIKEWLRDVYYDQWGQRLCSRQYEDWGSPTVGEIRGWGAIQQSFGTHKECVDFQDEVGKFIADAINEKVQREFGGK